MRWKDVLAQIQAGEEFPYRYVESEETKRGIDHPVFFTPPQIQSFRKRLNELKLKGVDVNPRVVHNLPC